jgi:glycosyltransferase involved in cell wall biosynthesis
VLIREQTRFVNGFVAVSDYYADFMGKLLSIPEDRMFVVPLGINLEGYERASSSEAGPLKIGYFARIAPEKGLHNLVEAYRLLRRRRGLRPTRLEVAGYLGREHRGYLRKLEKLLAEDGLSNEFQYHGTLDRQGKIDFLRSLAIASVPTDYEEPKGLFLLEAMAVGVPVVQPRRGAFAELLAKTGGGRLVPAGDNGRLALELEDLLVDSEVRRELGQKAFEGVRRHYGVTQMARSMESVLERVVTRESEEERETMTAGVATS